MKKLISVLMVVAVLVSLSGCSKVEINFYNTIKEMASLEDFNFKGELGVDINKINSGDEETDSQIKALLDGKSIKYEGAINSKENTLNLVINVDSGDTSEEFLRIFAEDKYFYISKDTVENINNLLGGFLGEDEYEEENQQLTLTQDSDGEEPGDGDSDDEEEYPEVTIDGIVYIQLDMTYVFTMIFEQIESMSSMMFTEIPEFDDGDSDEYQIGYVDGFYYGSEDAQYDTDYYSGFYNPEYEGVQDYKDGYDAGYDDGYEQVGQILDELNQYKDDFISKANAAYLIDLYRSLLFKEIDVRIAEYYDDLELGLVEKKDNRYLIHIDLKQISEILDTINQYEMDNYDTMCAIMGDYLKALTVEQLIISGINPVPERLQQYIDTMYGLPDGTDYPQGIFGFNESETSEVPDESEESDGTEDDDYDDDYDEEDLLEGIEAGVDITFEKTGISAYKTSSSFYFRTAEDSETDEELDIVIYSTEEVNPKGKGDVGLKDKVVNSKAAGSTIRLTLPDNIEDCGIYYDTSANMTNAVKLKVTSKNSH